MCNRLYQASGIARFRDAALAWIDRGLAYPRMESVALVDGAAGVGLGLLAALAPTPPDWDRLLLCDLPPR